MWLILQHQTQLDKQSELTTRQFFFSIPASINFVAQCFPTVTYAHPDFAKLQVLSTMMSQSFLHREIREKGGAYGGGAGQSSGLFYFYSYRDPNVDKTINSFKGAVDWVLSGRKESANTFSEQVFNDSLQDGFNSLFCRTLRKPSYHCSLTLICQCHLQKRD
jgi:Zn-dependent M16 (insulinase) family peptidase